MTGQVLAHARSARISSRILWVAVGAAIGLAAVGCGNSTSGANAAASETATGQPPAAPTGSAGPGRAQGGFAPAASGLVAQVSTTFIEVQNAQTGQTTVSWTSSTTFEQTATGTLSQIKVGDCVTAIAASAPSSASSGPASSEPLTAQSLVVSQPVDGRCDNGFGDFSGGPGGFGGTGQRPTAFPSGRERPSSFPSDRVRPSAFPSARASGEPGRARGAGAQIATGAVSSISGDRLVLTTTRRTPSSETSGSSGPSAATATESVSVTSSTAVQTQEKATAAALKVGQCVTAQGKADSSGAVTATSIQIRDAVNGQCASGASGARAGQRSGS